MKRFYNKVTFINELKKRGIIRSYDALFVDQKRGLLIEVGQLADGKRLVPIYDDSSVNAYIKRINELKKSHQVRMRILT